MKKILLLAAAFIATATAFAQTNLALGKHVYPVGDLVTGVTEEGLQKLTDGIDNQWYNLRNNNGGDNIGDVEELKLQSWYIDLGAEYDIQKISMTWEGAYATDYTVSVTNINPADGNVEWNVIITEENSAHYTTETNPKSSSHDITLENKVRYVKFTPIKLINDAWGCKMGEFYVWENSAAVLSTFSVPVFVVYNADGITIEPTILDAMGNKFTDDVTYIVSDGATIEKTEDGKLLLKAAVGTYTVTATAGDVSISQNVNIWTGDTPAAPNEEDIVFAVYDKNTAEQVTWQTGWGQQSKKAEDFNLNGLPVASFYDFKDVFVTTKNAPFNNMMMMDFNVVEYNSNLENGKNPISSLHYDVMTLVDAKGAIQFEGTDVKDWNITTKANKWTSFDVDVENATKLHVLDLHLTDNDGNALPGVLVANIYFSNKKATVVDTEAPEFTKAEAIDVTEETAKIVTSATDNVEGILTYTLTGNNAEPVVKEANAGEEVTFELTGLTQNTEYTYTVSVADAAGNKADNKTVTFTTEKSTIPAISEGNQAGRVSYVITGEATDVEQINTLLTDINKLPYDLRNLKIAEGITKLTPANPNAMFVVTDEQAAQLTETKNLFMDREDIYLVPRARYEMTDGYPVYTNYFISTNDVLAGATEPVGFKYTRKISGGKYVTTSLPCNGVSVSALKGISVYAFAEQTEEDGKAVYTFNKLADDATLVKYTPYILYSATDATLEIESGEQLSMQSDVLNNEENKNNIHIVCGNLTFHGNYETFAGDGTQYGLLNSTESIVLNKVDGGTIGAFRGYFTVNGDESAAKNIRFIFNNGGTDGISSVNGETTAKAGNVYTIDGRFVNSNGSVDGLAKGLYIVSGKKVVIK